MSDEPRDRDELWDGADGADEEPEPFVAGVGDEGSAPERGQEPQREARPHLDEDPADRDRFEIGDDEDFDLAALEAAVAELGIDVEDDAWQPTPAQTSRPQASEPQPPQPATREPETREPEAPGPASREPEAPEPASRGPETPEPPTRESTPEPGLFDQRRQPAPPSTPAPPAAPRSQEPAAPPEPPPAAPPTAMPAAAAEEPEHAESIAALWDLASDPSPEEPTEDEIPDDEPSPGEAAVPEQPEGESPAEDIDEPEVPEVPEPSEVDLDLTNFTAKGGSGAAGRGSSKRRKGLFRR